MITINRVPINSVEAIFGESGDERDFVKITFPFVMRASWNKDLLIRSFYGHKYIGEAVVESLEEVLDYYGNDFIHDNNLDIYGGCYANRQTVNGKRKSVHAWGLAVDYLPNLGAYGKPTTIPYHIVNAFKKRGFVWGGDWSYPDGMHFSAINE